MAEAFAHVPVPYPTGEDGAHSAGHILRHGTGQEVIPAPELVAHAWVLTGAALGTLYPPGGPVAASAAKGKMKNLTKREKETLQEFADAAKERNVVGLDPERFRFLAKMALEILMKFLSLAVVLGLLAPVARADDADARARAAMAVARAQELTDGLKAELDRIDKEIKAMEGARPKPGDGFRLPAPAARNAMARGVHDAIKSFDACPDGCCDEKGGPTRQADTAVASLGTGRDDMGSDWRTVSRAALRSRKPVLEWTDSEMCPRCVDDTRGEFAHFFAGTGGKSVNVWLPGSDGEFYKIGTLTKWVEGSPKWGHAASARKVVRAWNAGRPTTLDGWAAPEPDPSMGPPPDSPLWGRTMTVAAHDPAATFRDPAFVVTPAPAHAQTFAPPPVAFSQPPVMMRPAPMMSAPRTGMFRGGRVRGGCSGGSCG